MGIEQKIEGLDQESFEKQVKKETTTELIDMWIIKETWNETRRSIINESAGKGEENRNIEKNLEESSSQTLVILDELRSRGNLDNAISEKKKELSDNHKAGSSSEVFNSELQKLENLLERLGK